MFRFLPRCKLVGPVLTQRLRTPVRWYHVSKPVQDDVESGHQPGSRMERRKKRKASKTYLEKKERRRARKLKKLAGTVIDLPEYLSTKGLSQLLGVTTVTLLKILINLGITPRSSDEYLVPEIIDLLVAEFHRIPNRQRTDKDLYPRPLPGPSDKFPPRPPVVAILGHVNHGKTTLLDALRASKVKIVDGEAGGITQHIGAFSVPVGKEKITFLDTPGHAAFEAMRSRGVRLADIVILVVDSTRGVQAQTLTCIRHLTISKTPIVVALTKIDKKGGKKNQVIQELQEAGVVVESLGGKIPLVQVSALKGNGLNELKETLLLQAGLMHIMADREGRAEVVILETLMDRAKGLISSGIVRCGTLKKNDLFVVGRTHGKVRRIFSEGKLVTSALPGFPIEIVGYESKDNLPSPGDVLIVVENEKVAKETVFYRSNKDQELERKQNQLIDQERKIEEKEMEDLDRLYALENGLDPEPYVKQKQEEREMLKPKEIPIILKGDVSGSMEAIEEQIKLFPRNQVVVNIVKKNIGAISDGDVKIATTTTKNKCLIIGFNVPVLDMAKVAASSLGVRIHVFTVIYSLLDFLMEYCSSLLPPDVKYVEIAHAKV
eukprot:TRINITY_DN4064_c0_g2_i5.p1 TRINITY_DN4064_c0_g2~~TRINITY_DN4064_c0_g2_i5.p1  ORF type:complete len:604 (-),score=127.12 TRINITY_DN4064_c0_g2_i5:636-2447(-)